MDKYVILIIIIATAGIWDDRKSESLTTATRT